MQNNEKYFKFILLIFSSFLGIFILNFVIDYFIYQKNYESKYYVNNPNYNTKIIEINNSEDEIYPNLGSLITNNELTLIISKNKLINFGDIPNSKIVLCNEDGKYVFFNSDKFGFRNNNENYISEDFKNGKMPVLIGDSFGLGVCVNSEVYLKNIKDKIINLSVSGSGPISQAALLNEYINKYNTEKIIWLFYEGNDMLDLEIEKKNLIFQKYLTKYDNWPNLKYFDNIKKNEKILADYVNKIKKNSDNNETSFKEIKYGKDFSLIRLIKLTAIRNIFRNNKNSNNYGSAKNLVSYFETFDVINKILVNKKIEVNMVFLPSYKTIQNGKVNGSIKDIKNILEFNYDNVIVYNFDEHLIKKFQKGNVYINPRSHFSKDAYKELYLYLENII